MKSTLSCKSWIPVFAVSIACASLATAEPPDNSLTVVTAHVPGASKAELSTKGAMSVYVRINGKVVLFDTGAEDNLLGKNLEDLGLATNPIDAVVLSHNNPGDFDGLPDTLGAAASKAKIFVPAPVGESFFRHDPNIETVAVTKPVGVLPDAWLIGPMQYESPEGNFAEQVLVLDIPDGLVVVVGCSHPGIISVVRRVKQYFGARKIQLVAGGPHLGAASKNEIKEISLNFQQMGIEKLAFGQCTGNTALKIFRRDWRERLVSFDFGNTVRF
jgi:7,8-dihydropterin-6-yl-methyl-4-(beta-D-ribofuranosyl)aminobenzene 5'-phosphate synthase